MSGTCWPEPGRCGACTRPARRYPSGRWEHDGVPCALRSQTLHAAFGMPLPPAMFVPTGDPLPSYTSRDWPWLPGPTDPATGLPSSIGLVNPHDVDEYWDRVREQLRVEADTRDAPTREVPTMTAQSEDGEQRGPP